MKLKVNDLIFKGKWETYCNLKGLDAQKVNRGQIDDQMEVTLTPEEVKALDLDPKTSVCGHSDDS